MNTKQNNTPQPADANASININLSVWPDRNSVSDAEAVYEAFDTRKEELMGHLLNNFDTGFDEDALGSLEEIQALTEVQRVMFVQVSNLAFANYQAHQLASKPDARPLSDSSGKYRESEVKEFRKKYRR